MKKLRTAFKLAGVIFVVTSGLRTVAGPSTSTEESKRGLDLFLRNCAHCHGDDAHGDEGPDLHNLKKSDARISKFINQGIKGEMPAFGSKLNDADVKAVIAFLRTLKDKSLAKD